MPNFEYPTVGILELFQSPPAISLEFQFSVFENFPNALNQLSTMKVGVVKEFQYLLSRNPNKLKQAGVKPYLKTLHLLNCFIRGLTCLGLYYSHLNLKSDILLDETGFGLGAIARIFQLFPWSFKFLFRVPKNNLSIFDSIPTFTISHFVGHWALKNG